MNKSIRNTKLNDEMGIEERPCRFEDSFEGLCAAFVDLPAGCPRPPVPAMSSSGLGIKWRANSNRQRCSRIYGEVEDEVSGSRSDDRRRMLGKRKVRTWVVGEMCVFRGRG